MNKKELDNLRNLPDGSLTKEEVNDLLAEVERLREALLDLLDFTTKAMDSSSKYFGQSLDIRSVDRARAALSEPQP